MKLWQGIVTGLVAYAVFLVSTAPAARLLPLLQPLLPAQVQLQGIEGTVWSGSAAQVNAGREVQLQALHWQVRPLALLTGKAEVALTGQLEGRALQARAGKPWFGHPYLIGVRGEVPAQRVLAWLQLRQIGVQGQLEFDLDEVKWSAGRMPAFAGTLTWSPASLATPAAIEFGRAQLESRIGDAGASLGKLTTSGSSLLVEADVVLEANGAYRLDAVIRQNGDVPEAVATFLSTFAEYRNGSYHFDWSNTL